MKIYQPGKNQLPRVVGTAVTFVGLVLLGHGVKDDSFMLPMGLFFAGLGVLTFFGKYERYIDLLQKRVITSKKWLWFSWGHQIPLSHYKHISVVQSPGSGLDGSEVTYDVNLVGKDAASDHSGGFNTNMYLKLFDAKRGGMEKAFEFGNNIANQLGLEVVSDLPFYGVDAQYSTATKEKTMAASAEKDFKKINRDVVITHILGAPGLALLALAFYGFMVPEEDLFHPVLSEQNVLYGCLAVGGMIQIWQAWRVHSLRKKRLRAAGYRPL